MGRENGERPPFGQNVNVGSSDWIISQVKVKRMIVQKKRNKKRADARQMPYIRTNFQYMRF